MNNLHCHNEQESGWNSLNVIISMHVKGISIAQIILSGDQEEIYTHIQSLAKQD